LTTELTCSAPTAWAKVYKDDNERHFWQGEDPDPEDQEGFEVYNKECKYPSDGTYAFEGQPASGGQPADVGLACLDDSDPEKDRYRIVHMGCCEPEPALVRPVQCFEPGSQANAYLQEYNESTGEWEDVSGAQVTVKDIDCMVFALPTERFWVIGPIEGLYFPIAESGLYRRARVTSQIACGGSGTGTILKPASEGGTCNLVDSSCQVTICNPGHRKIACDGEEKIWIRVIPGTCNFFVLENRRAERAVADLDANLCPETGDVDIKNVEFRNVCSWDHEPSNAKNPFGLAGCEDDLVHIEWDEGACNWYITEVKHRKAQRIMSSIRYKDCAIDRYVYKDVAIMLCGGDPCGEPEWELAITMYEVAMVSDVSVACSEGSGTGTTADDTCELKVRKKTCCLLDDECTDLGWTTLLSGRWETVLTDVYQQGLNIVGDFRDVCVLCAVNDWTEMLIEGTDCESGTGTGTGTGG